MKNTVVIIVLGLVAIVGTCVTLINVHEQKNAAAEFAALEAEAKQRAATKELKKSENERRKAELEKMAAEKKSAAAKAEKETAEARVREAIANKQAAAANERAALSQKAAEELAAKRALDERGKTEAEARIAAAKQAGIDAELAIIAATNAQRQAELDVVVNRRLQAQAEQQAKEAAVRLAEFKKLELDKRLAEVAELQALLQQREEATRPERTIKDIMDENERRRAEEEAAAAAAEERRLAELREKDYKAYEEAMARRRKINKEGVAAVKMRELTAAEKILKFSEDEIAQAGNEGRSVLHKRIIAQLEPEIRCAIQEGRMEDAEFFLKNLQLLVPDYKASADLLKKE